MESQKIIVVGAGSGIGRAIAHAAAVAGADIVIAGRTSSRLDQTAAMLPAHTPTTTIAADITKETEVIELFDQVGEFDHLISTIADAAYQPIQEFDMDAARRTIDSKLASSMLLAKHGCARVRAGGSITLISGIAAHRPSSGGAIVAAVNGALEALTRALAVELAPVRVNAVSPGWVDTPIWDVIAGDRKKQIQGQMADRLPVGHIGAPEDIARAVLALAGNGFITGSVLHADGGHRLV